MPPHRYPEFAALVGETSDNLPGVPGVGQKTAAKWVSEFDGLDDLIDRVDEVKGKAGETLRAHLATCIRNRRLNALVRDLACSTRTGRPAPQARGTARRCTRSSTAWSSGCCATGSSSPSRARRRPTSRLRLARAGCSRPDAVAAWLQTPPASRTGVARARHLARRHR